MKKHLFSLSLVAVLSIAFTACAQIKGEGPIVKKTLTVKDFEGVSLKGSFDVIVTQGEKEVIAEGHGNIIDRLETEVKDGVLQLELEKGNYWDFKLVVFVSTDQLENLKVAGSGDMQVDGFKGLSELEVSVAGSGNLKGKGLMEIAGECEVSVAGSGDVNLEVACADLEGNIAGSGTIKIEGRAKKVEVSIAGSGDFEGSGLESKEAEVSISGSGDVQIGVEEELEVSIAGSGDVLYHGSPDVESSVMGSGDVRKAK